MKYNKYFNNIDTEILNEEYPIEQKDLNEENKQLKELCNKYEEEHKTTFETWLKERKVLNELEEWLEDNWKSTQDIWYVKIINKMQELKEKYNYK